MKSLTTREVLFDTYNVESSKKGGGGSTSITHHSISVHVMELGYMDYYYFKPFFKNYLNESKLNCAERKFEMVR